MELKWYENDNLLTILFLAAVVVVFSVAIVFLVVMPESTTDTPTPHIGRGIYRVVDDTAGMVCYESRKGLDCIPISETILGAK
jgi:hypothetical protein